MLRFPLILAQDAAAETAGTEESNAYGEGAEQLADKVMSGNFSEITTGEVWTLAQPIIVAVVLIIVVLLIAGWAKKLTVKATTKAKVDITLAKFFGNIAKWVIMLLGAITILQTFGVEATSFAAVVAALGFAVGMALSGTLGNVASGIMLLIFRPFKVGDVVNVAGVVGSVDEIGLFTTSIDTPDKRRFIVPNGSISNATIENISHHSVRRVDVGVGVDYTADIDKTRSVLEAAAQSVEAGLADPAPAIVLGDLGDSAVNWTVRLWVNAGDFWPTKEALTRAVKMHLDQAGIGIPFPQMDVHVDGKVANA